VAHLPNILRVRDVDVLLDTLETSGSKQLVLQIEAAPIVAPLALARFLGLLARAYDLRVAVQVNLGPSLERSLLTTQALGVCLVAYGARFIDAKGSDQTSTVVEEAQETIRAAKGIAGTDNLFVLPVVDSPSGLRPTLQSHSVASQIDERTFPSAFENLLSDCFPNLLNRSEWRARTARYAFEVWQNTSDHGTRSLAGAPLESVRALILSFTPAAQINANVGDSVLAVYMDSFRRIWGDQAGGILEISAVDSGIGIPAQISRRADIYEASVSDQLTLVQRAMYADQSTKKKRGSGLGFPKVLRVADRTRGLLMFRTGHVTAYKHFFPPLDLWPSMRIYGDTDVRRGSNKGTQVSLLIPIESAP
jgi:hypothetical protein